MHLLRFCFLLNISVITSFAFCLLFLLMFKIIHHYIIHLLSSILLILLYETLNYNLWWHTPYGFPKELLLFRERHKYSELHKYYFNPYFFQKDHMMYIFLHTLKTLNVWNNTYGSCSVIWFRAIVNLLRDYLMPNRDPSPHFLCTLK